MKFISIVIGDCHFLFNLKELKTLRYLDDGYLEIHANDFKSDSGSTFDRFIKSEHNDFIFEDFQEFLNNDDLVFSVDCNYEQYK